MFIENPHKKETYSFRVKPELLENIKNYAKATDQTVPEILNDMIEEKTKDLYLTNDYLEDKLSFNGVIGLPPLTEMYDNGNYTSFQLVHNTENRDLYEIQRVPNNLDIWDDKEGYKSNKRGVNHEGISFILAPDLITKPEYLENPELLFCCFVPIYFEVKYNSIRNSTISVTNISFDNALKKINQAPNIELLDEFTKFTTTIREVILDYSNRFKTASKRPDGTYYVGGFIYSDKHQLLLDLYSKLVTELNEYSIEVNTNFLNHYDGAIERQTQKLENNILPSDTNPYVIKNLLNDEIDYLKTELDKTTKENEDLKETVTQLQQQVNTISEIFNKEYSKEEILNKLSKQ